MSISTQTGVGILCTVALTAYIVLELLRSDDSSQSSKQDRKDQQKSRKSHSAEQNTRNQQTSSKNQEHDQKQMTAGCSSRDMRSCRGKCAWCFGACVPRSNQSSFAGGDLAHVEQKCRSNQEYCDAWMQQDAYWLQTQMHWAYCAEHVLFSSCELASLFARSFPSQRLQPLVNSDSQMYAIVEWKGFSRFQNLLLSTTSTGSVHKVDAQMDRFWEAPLTCAAQSRWQIADKNSADSEVDYWRVLFPKGLFAAQSPKVALWYTLGRAYNYMRFSYYLRWAKVIIATFRAEGSTRSVQFADLACGAGWMGTIVATTLPNTQVHFADIDVEVDAQVRRNIRANGIAKRSFFSSGDLFSAYHRSLKGTFDHIWFNPPQSVKTTDDEMNPNLWQVNGPSVSVFAPTSVHFFERVEKEFESWLRPDGGTLWLGVEHDLAPEVWDLFSRRKSREMHAWNFAVGNRLIRISTGAQKVSAAKSSNHYAAPASHLDHLPAGMVWAFFKNTRSKNSIWIKKRDVSKGTLEVPEALTPSGEIPPNVEHGLLVRPNEVYELHGTSSGDKLLRQCIMTHEFEQHCEAPRRSGAVHTKSAEL